MDWDRITDKFGSFGERAGKGLKRLFGSENERFLRTLEPVVAGVNAKEAWAEGLDQEAMRAEVQKYRAAVIAGEAELDDYVAPMFALTREASKRTLGLRHFDVQLVGGYVMHQGKIAEMMTGEGKTLMATLALSLNTLSGRPTYLVTVNDYLARRDAAWMKPIFEYLGLTVGAIQSDMDAWDRKPIYDSDVVYGTNNEFGFDYLRDNMKTSVEQQVQKDLYFAIVDEVDSILIDESRTPLIISGPAEEGIGKYQEADRVARILEDEVHYEVKEKERSASLLEAGIVKAQEILEVESFYEPGFEDWPHYIENAIRAPYLVHQGQGVRGRRRAGPAHRQDRPGSGHCRRVHRTQNVGPPLVRWPAPGGRGQGGVGAQAGVPDPGNNHFPELLPHVRQAVGHDGNGHH